MDPDGNTVLAFGERAYVLDQHGFLDPPEQWDEAFADGMAARVGIHMGCVRRTGA